jgi:tetratricopeptide (TPR) repeat protein
VGEVKVIFERNRVSLRPSLLLTEEGKTLARTGRYGEALELFHQASKADRFNPAPRYQEGFSLLHLRRYSEAVEAFQATEALAPGWFHCRSFLWLARQLSRGNIDHRLFVFLRMLEDGPMPLPDKVREAQRVLAKGFEFPLLYLIHGEHLLELKRTAEATEMFRKGLAVAIEPDVRSRLLVNLAFVQEWQPEKKRLLRAVLKINGNLFAQAIAALALHE